VACLAQPVLADDSLSTSLNATEPTPNTPVNAIDDSTGPADQAQRYDQGVTIQKVTIEGNQLIDETEIKRAIATRPGSLYNKQTLKDDLRRIYDMGYFTEKIKATPIATNQGIILKIRVEENVPVTGFVVQGNSVMSNKELLGIFSGQTGLPQNIGQLNEGIEKVEKAYADKGYILARVKGIKDDPDGTINIEVNEGSVDSIQFVGNRKTKDNVLRRMMTTKTGDVYNEKSVSQDLKRIFSTQAFGDVRRVITASPENPDKYNLVVEVDEKRTGAISLGGGLDTQTGIFGSLGYSDPNFLGKGQTFNSALSVGSGYIGRDISQANSRIYQFDVGWTNPSINDTNNALSVNLYGRDLASFNIPLGIERRIGSEVVWSKPLESIKNASFSLGLRGERISMRDAALQSTLDEFGINDTDRKAQLKGGSFVSLSPTIAFDTRDNRFNPTTGWLNTFTTTGAAGLSGSSYGTVSTNIRRYFKIRDGVTLALNTQAGSNLLGDIPDFNMFRMGGAYTVRGYQEGGLGAGNRFLLASAELRTKVPFLGPLKQKFPILDTLNLATFFDVGQVYGLSSASKAFDRPGVGASIGAGLRFNIPALGPIRLDYAFPLASANSRYTRSFNFGVGQKF
jgi:outer membrane protein insertion porin family